MNTRESFAILIADKPRCLELGLSDANYRQIKARFMNEDPLLRESQMDELLEKAGWKKKVEWKKP